MFEDSVYDPGATCDMTNQENDDLDMFSDSGSDEEEGEKGYASA